MCVRVSMCMILNERHHNNMMSYNILLLQQLSGKGQSLNLMDVVRWFMPYGKSRLL